MSSLNDFVVDFESDDLNMRFFMTGGILINTVFSNKKLKGMSQVEFQKNENFLKK